MEAASAAFVFFPPIDANWLKQLTNFSDLLDIISFFRRSAG